MLEMISSAWDLVTSYPRSCYGSFKNEGLFSGVKTYCMFIGYPRSGHSLIGSLLDAHPKMIIANELGTLKYIAARFNRRQIYYLLLENSRRLASGGRRTVDFSYHVPRQWQGRFNQLQVLGDKHGEGSTLRLRARPWLLQRLRKTVGIHVKLIHVIRNPYDSITTVRIKAKRPQRDLSESVEYYFSLCETVNKLKGQINSADLFELKHESFVENPKAVLEKLCSFLGVEASQDYLNDCASIVFKSPHKSRYETSWSQDWIERVKCKIENFRFLQGYTYEN